MIYVILVALALLALVFAFLFLRFWQSARTLQKRYAGITDIQSELTATKSKLDQAKKALQAYELETQERRTKLAHELKQLESKREELTGEISLLEENLEDISFGLYKPHFSFQTSEEYKAALDTLRDRERHTIRDGQAAVCHTQWTVKNRGLSAQFIKIAEAKEYRETLAIRQQRTAIAARLGS